MTLNILNVAYPLAPVGPDAVGGAEQILSALDAALVAAGHRSIVVACEGSRVFGTHIPVPYPSGPLTEEVRAQAQAACRREIASALGQGPIDLVHLHGVDFYAYLPKEAVTLATLHLPMSFYPADAMKAERDNVFMHGVSGRQCADAPSSAKLLAPIPNGVDVSAFRVARRKRDFALVLSRICPEKGIHLALDASIAANASLLIGGQVFPYPSHQFYFDREVAPRLDARRRFLGPLGFARKRRLLCAARCLLVPSLAAETSSLVAMEALASGTPVIAFDAGALPDIVEHGKTGFIVKNADEMALALSEAATIDPHACRKAAEARFDLSVMTRRYLDLYRRLARRGQTAA